MVAQIPVEDGRSSRSRETVGGERRVYVLSTVRRSRRNWYDLDQAFPLSHCVSEHLDVSGIPPIERGRQFRNDDLKGRIVFRRYHRGARSTIGGRRLNPTSQARCL